MGHIPRGPLITPPPKSERSATRPRPTIDQGYHRPRGRGRLRAAGEMVWPVEATPGQDPGRQRACGSCPLPIFLSDQASDATMEPMATSTAMAGPLVRPGIGAACCGCPPDAGDG